MAGRIAWAPPPLTSGDFLDESDNLSDLPNAATARTNLGAQKAIRAASSAPGDLIEGELWLDTSTPSMPLVGIGTVAGTVAAGNDSRITGAVQKSSLPINPTDAAYAGGMSTSATDNSAAWAAAVSTANTQGRDIDIPYGNYKFTSGITWNARNFSVIGRGLVDFDFTGMTSGYAITVTGTPSGGSDGFRNVAHKFSGIRVIGTRSDSTTVDGIYIGDPVGTTANVSHLMFENMHIYGFRDQWFYADNTWCVSQSHCISTNAARYSLNLDGLNNAGENYQFTNSTFANCTNAGGTGVAVYTNAAGNIDSCFTSCSFDYNDVLIDHNGGNMTLVGCHLENNSLTNAMVRLHSTGGGYRTTMTVVGGQISPTESASSSRDHLFEVKSGSSDHVYLTFSGAPFNTYDRNVTVFRNLSSSLPTVSYYGGTFDNTGAGTRAATLGQYTNLLTNGDFEGSTTFLASSAFPLYSGQNWAKDGTITYTFDTTVFRSGARSLKMVGTGTVATSALKQMIAVTPGKRLYFNAWINITAISAGSVQPRVSWYLNDVTTRTVVAYNPTAMTATTSGWVPVTFAAIVPPGINYCLIDFQNTNLNGTVYVDDVTVSLL